MELVPTGPTIADGPLAATSSVRADPLTRACRIGAAIGLIPYLAILWDFGFHPMRRMTADGLNADFFDVQARALFDGHFHVPPGSLGIEAFIVDGRHYMYFGVFPAILRMPILLVTDGLDGKLTAPSMLLGWFVLVLALTRLIRLVRTAVVGDRPVESREAVLCGMLMASTVGGSVLLYVASQPWVYHEVYVWNVALTIGAAASLVAVWDRADRRNLAIAFAFTLATMLNRAPAGWAMAVAAIATGGWMAWSRRASPDARTGRRRGMWLAAGGAMSIVVGSAVNMAKFGHVFRFPLDKQLWTKMSIHRRLVLQANDGRIDGPQFIATTLRAYFRPDGVRFVRHFPFITPPATPPSPVGDVTLDESFRTASITATMPFLLVLAVWGLVVVVRSRGTGIAKVRLPLAGTILLLYGVVAFGYVAPRYTSEFIPALAFAGAVGVVDISRRLAGRRTRVAPVLSIVLTLLATYGTVANGAIALVNERQRWRGSPLEQLIELQVQVGRVTGNPVRDLVRNVDELPPRGLADELAVVGDCDALYVGTGELSGSWIPVQFRERSFRLTVGADGLAPGSFRLMWFSGYTLRRLHVQVGLDRRIRLVLIGTPPDTAGHWLRAEPGDVITVNVHGNTARNQFVATATVESASPTTSRVDAPMTEWDRQFLGVAITPRVVTGSDAEAAAIGVVARTVELPAPALCDSLRAERQTASAGPSAASRISPAR